MLSEISQTQERKILCDVSFMVSLNFKNYRKKSTFKDGLGVRGALFKRYKVVTCLDLGRSVSTWKAEEEESRAWQFCLHSEWAASLVCRLFCLTQSQDKNHSHSHEETFTCLTFCPSARA